MPKTSALPEDTNPTTDDFSVSLDNATTTLKKAKWSNIAALLLSGHTKRLGLNTKTTTGTVLPTSYTTYCTVTATSSGGEVELNLSANLADGSSGAARSASVRVQCDGVTVTGAEYTSVSVALNGGTGWSFIISHTPASGSHTWTLQVLASTASATLLHQSSLRVAEVMP